MSRRLVVAALALAVCLQSARPAVAWNETAHMVVALIAYRRLSDEQRKQVGEILKAHPHYKSILIAGKPPDVDEGEWAFLRASFWPDMVRPSAGKPEEITKYHRGPWHYCDFPFIAPKDKATIDAAQLKANDESLLTALPACMAKLGRSDSSGEEKAVDLCWVLHLVGDVHQPLHAAALYSEEYKLGDMGGNALAIRNRGTPTRLHAY
jgi:S1/P1 Nuclease